MEIKIHSPVGAGNVSFIWPLDKLKEAKRAPRRREEKHSIGEDIIETIRLISEDLPNLKNALDNNILTDYDPDDYYSVKHVCDRYNRMINSLVALEKGTSLPQKRINKYPSKSMLKHVLQQTYFRSVIDPDKLNNYEPFSPEVYGETSYDLICDIINHVQFTDEDIFIDLGSGIGQVVLQVAASTPCKLCYGIEKAEIPSSYAIQMSEIFQQWMKFYGKSVGEYEILKGDFLSEEFRNMINSATIIFVNNFAFGPEVDHQLKQIFSELKDGVRIFSSKRFCAANFRISNRNLSDIGAIMEVSDVELIGQVSWTDKPVQYFLQMIDRSKLELYFERLKLNNMKEDESDSSKGEENKVGKVDSEESDLDDPDFEVSRKKKSKEKGSSRSSSRSSKEVEGYPNRVVIKNDNKNDKWTIKTQGALEIVPKKSEESKSERRNGILEDPKTNSYMENKNENFVSNRLESILLGNRLDYYPKKYRIDLKSHSESNLETNTKEKHSDGDLKFHYTKYKVTSDNNHYQYSPNHSDGHLKSTHSDGHIKTTHSDDHHPIPHPEPNHSDINQKTRHPDSDLKNLRIERNRLDSHRKNREHKRSDSDKKNRSHKNSSDKNRSEPTPLTDHTPLLEQTPHENIPLPNDRVLPNNETEPPNLRIREKPVVKQPEITPKIPSIVIKTTKQGKSRIIQKKIITKTKPRKPKKKKKVIKIPELDLLHEQITKCPEASASFENENFEAYTSSELIKASGRLLDDYKIVDNDKWENYASDRLKTVQNGNIYDERYDEEDRLKVEERWDYDNIRVMDENRTSKGLQSRSFGSESKGYGSESRGYCSESRGYGSESRGNGSESGGNSDSSFQTGVKRRYDEGGFLRAQSAALDNLLSSYQSQFLEMVRIMQTPEFRHQIEVQIEEERNRNRVLKKSVGIYEDTVKYLMKKGENLIKERMLELSITNFTTRDLFRTAREWFNEQGHLRNIVSELENQNAELENEIEKRRVELYKTHYMDYQEVFLNNNKLPKAVSIEVDVDEVDRQIIAG